MSTPALPSASESLAIVKGDVTDAPDDIDTEDEETTEDSVAAIASVLDDSLRLTDDGVFRRVVTLEKQAGRKLDLAKSATQIDVIAAAGLNADRVKRGWTTATTTDDNGVVFNAVGSPSDGWTYSTELIVECRPKSVRRTLPIEFDNIVSSIDAKAKLPANRWRVALVDGKPFIAGEAQRITADPNEELGYAPFELPDEEAWLANFSHLYGLEDYIDIIRSVLELAVMSEWQDRVNIALIGPPACGKSDLCKSVRRAVGEESVLEYDATSTSMAGAQEQLGNMEELPRVLILEEIEKAPESALPWLLSVLDLRGEVRKKTARSDISKSVHMIGICTVNDEAKFNQVASGALASRFSMPLQFTRPTRDVLWKILKREIDKIGGNIAWIDPALDFAEELQTASQASLYIDPRKLIAICLTGRDRLLLPADHPKSFQGMYRRTMLRATTKA